MDEAPAKEAKEANSAILENIKASLKQKDDTSRFVGLTMMRSFLDSDSELVKDEEVLLSLWNSISTRFLDRLIKSKGNKDTATHGTLDLGVSVIYKFSTLLPESAKRDKRMVERIPMLVGALLVSSDDTTELILQALLELVTYPEGAQIFVHVEDQAALLEIAPSSPMVFDVLERAWLNSMVATEEKSSLRPIIDRSILKLVSSFKHTDGVTLLRFLGDFLRRSHPEPKWIKSITDFVRNLLTKRPNAEARNAYILVSASLLEVYPAEASQLLFSNDESGDKPFSYLLVTLVLTEIRAMAPRLLSLLNDPSYPDTAKRLGSAFDVATHFIAYLIRVMDSMLDDDDDETAMMPAEFLLKLRTSLSETLSLAVEFLRDRWDASVAGAMGLHPEARPGAAEQWTGYLPISWESSKDVVDNDPLILAMIRTLAIWLREDDNKLLRKEAAGLTDMFLELYQNSAAGKLDFRSPVLVALEGTVKEHKGIDALTKNDGWKILSRELVAILRQSSAEPNEADANRGQEIVRVLMPYVEAEDNGTEEDWMALVTHVAGWSPSDESPALAILDFQAAVLQLVTTLLVNAREGMRKRYVHSTSAIVEVAKQIKGQVAVESGSLMESLDDVISTLSRLR